MPQHVRAAEAEHAEPLHAPPADDGVNEFDRPSGRDSACTQLDHQLQAECCSDTPERVEAWGVAARLEAGDGGLRTANSSARRSRSRLDIGLPVGRGRRWPHEQIVLRGVESAFTSDPKFTAVCAPARSVEGAVCTAALQESRAWV